ncbi:glucan endo-1,3-beta-glucosidase 13 isoform X2 [Carex littledalei]|uniref:Glucan endo-1,3-beta-glucosidase 13 isoform X2 n=1 Tax=Carex littledalei TaxID=544730 RepID=A0A833V2X7_9POAL|nr:glucan endo-1,3-beta-glucosidase 13 isoform X2 [Carex littledalei]
MKSIALITTIHGILILELCLGTAAALQQKAESTAPTPTFSPPEGNTTFIDGTTWCVAHPSATQSDLQIALDWACGLGATDCSALQNDGPCYQPNTLLSHASYAFNSYYQQNGNSDIACNFGGTATLTKRDPSYGSCKYLASETSSASLSIPGRFTWMIGAISIVLHFKGYGCIY